MFIIYVENGFILHLVQGLIKIKVALEDESRREEGNKRYPGLLLSWKCRSIILWMEMRAKNDNYGSECSSLVCVVGRAELIRIIAGAQIWGKTSSEHGEIPNFQTLLPRAVWSHHSWRI